MNTNDFIDFIMDPLRLTLIIAAVVVVLAILIFGRRSSKQRDMVYTGSSRKDFSFSAAPAEDMLVDEEVIVLPPRKKESELNTEAEPHFSAREKSDEMDIETFDADTSIAPPPKTLVDKEPEPAIKSDLGPIASPQGAQAEQNIKTSDQAIKQEAPKPKKPKKQQFVVLHIIAAEGRPFNGKEIFDSTQTLGMALGKHNVFHYPADSAYVGDSAFCLVNMTAEGNFDIENLTEMQTNGVSLILTLPTIYSDGLTVFSNMLAVAQALSKKLGGDIIDQTRVPLTADLVTSIRSDIAHFEEQLRQQSPAVAT